MTKQSPTRHKRKYADELLVIRMQAKALAASGRSLRSIYKHYREKGLLKMSLGTFCRYMKESEPCDDEKMNGNNPIDYLIQILLRQNFPLKSIHLFLRKKSICRVSYSTLCRYINGERVLYCHEYVPLGRIASLIEEFHQTKERYMTSETTDYNALQNMCAIKYGKLLIPQLLVEELAIEEATAVRALFDSVSKQIALKFYPVLERGTIEVLLSPTLTGTRLVVPFSAFCQNFNLQFKHVVYLPLNMEYGLQPGGDPFDMVLDVDGAKRSPVGIARSLRRMAHSGLPPSNSQGADQEVAYAQ